MKGLLMLATTIVVQAALGGAADKAPRTVDGTPDLHGVWNYSSDVALERPKEYADRRLVTREERAKQNAAREATFDRLLNTGVGAHDKLWLDYEAQVEICEPRSSPTPRTAGCRRWWTACSVSAGLPQSSTT